jgi:hypothetical protein
MIAQTQKHFKGRTIKRVDMRAVNCWRFFFEDGGSVEIAVEAVIPPSLYGMAITEVKEPKS